MEAKGEIEWSISTAIGRRMNSLEKSLMCPICSDFLQNPHFLPCGHAFCSHCIRVQLDKTLNYTTSDICPACRVKATSDQLKPSIAFSMIMENYLIVRKDIYQLMNDMKATIPIISDTAEEPIELNCNTNSTIRKVPHAHFHGLSKEKARNILERACQTTNCKLRMDGDKDTLEKRYREFVHLNNSQIGSLHPLTLDEVCQVTHVL